MMSPAFASSFRLGAVCLVILAAFGGIGARLYTLHVVDGDKLSGIAQSNRRKIEVLQARRGRILDQHGNVLATTRAQIVLGVDPQSLREEDREKWPQLAQLIGMPLSGLEALMNHRTSQGTSGFSEDVQLVRWVKLHDALGEDDYQEVRDLNIRGVYGNRRFDRFYPGEELAAHLLGYMNREEVAVSGIERSMDFYLRGQDGWRESERDGRRNELAQFRSREVAPSDGLNVQLTIDMVVQHMIEEELRLVVAEHNPYGATIIVSEPVTGYILGMANYPTFNLNEYNTEPIAHQRNRAISDVMEPGSTFKIVPVAGALNEHLVNPETVFDCNITTIQVGNRVAGLPRDHRPLGEISVTEIVAKSSNVGAAHLGVKLGSHRLYDYAHRFGFGESTGFPIAGEVGGTLHEVRNWDGLTITRMPMGHAISATPLQIHFAMATIANRGILMRPQMVRRAFNDAGETVVSFAPDPRRRVVSEATARELSKMLALVPTSRGTAQQAEIPGFEVAGKTGTTQKIINGRYSSQHHIASFTGFFPASNPRVVMTIIVDDPRSAGSSYGGIVAAPSFKRVGEQLIQYLGIPPGKDPQNYFALEGASYDRTSQSGL